MRTAYIEKILYNYSEPTCYKLIEIDKDNTKRLEVFPNEISIWRMEDFDTAFENTKKIYCQNQFKIISKDEFDKKLNETLEKITELI